MTRTAEDLVPPRGEGGVEGAEVKALLEAALLVELRGRLVLGLGRCLAPVGRKHAI